MRKAVRLLELHQVVVRYGRGGRSFNAVDRVDLSIEAGRTVGLVGESGSGKSTLARAIVGLVPIAHGRILFEGEDVTSRQVRRDPLFRRRVQIVFQDPRASLNPRMSIRQTLTEALAVGGVVDRGTRQHEAAVLLERMRLTQAAMDRYPHQFSGGQLQRVAIARALAVGPRLMVLDEVTSALDVSVQADLLNLLRDLQREEHLAYLFISHDLGVVRYISDDVAVMYLGRTVECASTEQLFANPQHPYTGALMESVPEIGAEPVSEVVIGDPPDPHNPPPGCPFHPRCGIGPVVMTDRAICIEEDPHIGASARLHDAACHFAPCAPREASRDPEPRPEGFGNKVEFTLRLRYMRR